MPNQQTDAESSLIFTKEVLLCTPLCRLYFFINHFLWKLNFMFMILFKVPDHIENGEKEDAETRNTRMLDIKKIYGVK